jgi:predicted double-glycine peptidase
MQKLHKRRHFLRDWLSAWLMVSAHAGSQWLDVPYVQQRESTGCGSASIAMVMQYWLHQDARVDPAAADYEHIYALLSPSSRVGLRGQALKDYFEAHGFSTYVFNGELNDLRNHIQKGRPLVVCLDPRGATALFHYVVIVGIDASAVYFHDPARGKLLKEELKQFQHEWKATGNWTLLAVPRPGR